MTADYFHVRADDITTVMERLTFEYAMRITFTEPSVSSNYTIRCLPMHTAAQRLVALDVTLSPPSNYARAVDAFGNSYIYGRVDGAHREFGFTARGSVETGLADFADAMSLPQEILYRQASPLTLPGSQLRTLADSLRGATPAGIMHAIYRAMTYEKHVTNVCTTAEQALTLRRGVCQDYAHIMVAVCRMLGRPTRYVAGMMLGEGESHAWCEVGDGRAWFAYDPTNDIAVSGSHIKLAQGRDAADCPINRGIMRGNGTQSQSVSVVVSRA